MNCTPLQLTMPAPKAVQNVRPFSFHGVLDEDGSQADVLRACGITTLLDAALAGFHVTIFAYGQTGSGKTFTMAGREEVLALEDYSGTRVVHYGVCAAGLSALSL